MPSRKSADCDGLPDSGHDLLALQLKALGHPARLQILHHLAACEHCCGGDIYSTMPLAQSTVSQHMEMLKSAGLIDWHPQGTRSIFKLNRQALAALSAELAEIASSQSAALGKCRPQGRQRKDCR